MPKERFTKIAYLPTRKMIDPRVQRIITAHNGLIVAFISGAVVTIWEGIEEFGRAVVFMVTASVLRLLAFSDLAVEWRKV